MYVDDEIKEINEFNVWMKNKNFNIYENQKFDEYIRKVIFKYWIL